MRKSIREIVSTNIKEYRKNSKMTQAVLAEKIGKTVEMVCQLENNIASTKLITLEQIADVFGVEPYRLLLAQDYPEYEKLSPQLARLIAILQKQPEGVVDSLLNLFDQVKK